MLLKQLIIKKWNNILRSITFKMWLNLITSSSNSVWKTTLLRAIDYCLWSDGKDFYSDNEFKGSDDKKVLNFLTDEDIEFTLFFTLDNKECSIIRKFWTTKGLKINDVEYNDLDSFRKELNNIIFWIENNKPNFRNMLSKFIRKDILKMKNMLKTLHFGSTKNDYMLFYAQLFHFNEPNLIYEKYELEKVKSRLTKRITAVKWNNTKWALRQNLKLLDDDIKTINYKIRKLDLVKSWEYSLDKLSEIQKSIFLLRTQKWKLNLKLWFNKDSLLALSNQKSNIRTDYIAKIYNSANISIGNLQKTLEETILFHNTMVNNKIKFITHSTDNIEKSIKIINNDLNRFEKEESDILNLMSDKDNFANLYKLQSELAWKSQEKWAEKKILDLIEELEEEKKEIIQSIENINNKISIYTKGFEDNLFIFNKYFSAYSKDLYSSNYLLAPSDDYTEIIPQNIDFNSWWWAKKAYIGLFDLAYISYLNEKKSSYIRFTLHDSEEDTNHLSLKKIFTIANSINWQYIVSLLDDKINNIWMKDIEENIILSLSDNNKFFKIESSN